jgi:hypothetical protein
MTLRRDPLFQMLDSATADRILDGAIAAPDAPPGYERVVALLGALAEHQRPGAANVGAPPVVWRARHSARRRIALVAVAVATIIPATAGAAYANILPDSVGRPLVHLMHRIGLPKAPDQERNDHQPAANTAEPPTSPTRSTGDSYTTHPAAGSSASPASRTTPSRPPASKDADPPASSITPPASPPASTTAGAPPVVPMPHTSPKLQARATDRPTPPASSAQASRPIPSPPPPT